LLNVIAQDEGGILSNYKYILSKVFYSVKEKSGFGTLKNEGINLLQNYAIFCRVRISQINELVLEFKRRI